MTDYIAAGGVWADGVLAGIHHSNFRAALEDRNGNLNLIQSYRQNESGWSGDTGNDTLIGGRGNNTLDGGSGIDTARFTGKLADYSLARSVNTWTVKDIGGVVSNDSLSTIERLQFADTKLAIDLDGHAGTVAKTLGTVFGADSMANKTFVGIGLNMVDGGMIAPDLMQAALNAKLGTGFSNDAEIKLLYQNIIGISPSATDVSFWTEKISAGEYTQVSLAVAAANMLENSSNIGLVGLQQTGVEFV